MMYVLMMILSQSSSSGLADPNSTHRSTCPRLPASKQASKHACMHACMQEDLGVNETNGITSIR